MSAARSDEIVVATYNVEALFDTKKDHGTLDDEYLPHGHYAWNEAKLATKIANLGKVLRSIDAGRGPDIVALNEVENRAIVERLRDDALADLGYRELVHFDTECIHGLDNAILSRFPLAAPPTIHHSSRVGTEATRRPRGILEAAFDVDGVTLVVFVNHWPAGAGRAAAQRVDVAKRLRALVEQRVRDDRGSEIVVLGDFNAGPSEEAFGPKGLDATGDAQAVRDGGALLFHTMAAADVPRTLAEIDDAVRASGAELGSHFTRPYPYTGPDGEWNLFDQIFVSPGLLDDEGLTWVSGSTEVVREAFMLAEDGSPRTFFERGVKPRHQEMERAGFSDHLPVVTRLRRVKKAT